MKNKIRILFLLIFSVFLFFLSKHTGMFWDNVLFASKMGNYLYNHSLFNWYFPDSFDPGHPPFLAFIQALGWKFLGHKLWVSHLMLLPFIFGLLYQISSLINHYIKDTKYRILAFLLLISDPTFLTQLIIINPEVIQLFFFFMAINAILKDNTKLKTVSLFFLSIVSFRGMMLCGGVLLFDILRYIFINKQTLLSFLNLKNIISYSIGAIPGLSFIIWRLLTKGWLQTHPNSPWEDCWHLVNIKEFLMNLIILGHRYADFGRIGILIFIGLLFLLKRNFFKNKNIKEVGLLAISSVFFIIIVSLISTNPFGHRYFIASYLSLSLIAALLLIQLKKKKQFWFIVLIFNLLLGNLWIYPETIAQGWDASLAHIPYYSLREKTINYLDKNNIEIEQIETFFPNVSSLDEINLCGDKRKFKKFTGTSEYIFYSNVYNLSDNEYDILKNKYHMVKTFKKGSIYIKILKKN